MSSFKEQLQKFKDGLTPEQQAEASRTVNEVFSQPAAEANRTKPEEWRDQGLMSNAEHEAFKRRAWADSADTIREREAKEFAGARGFEVKKKD